MVTMGFVVKDWLNGRLVGKGKGKHIAEAE